MSCGVSTRSGGHGGWQRRGSPGILDSWYSKVSLAKAKGAFAVPLHHPLPRLKDAHPPAGDPG